MLLRMRLRGVGLKTADHRRLPQTTAGRTADHHRTAQDAPQNTLQDAENDFISRVRTIVTIGLSLRPIVALSHDYRSR